MPNFDKLTIINLLMVNLDKLTIVNLLMVNLSKLTIINCMMVNLSKLTISKLMMVNFGVLGLMFNFQRMSGKPPSNNLFNNSLKFSHFKDFLQVRQFSP